MCISDTRFSEALVDGPNTDMVLGQCVLNGHRPLPAQRPRWDRVLRFCATFLGVRHAQFVLNGNKMYRRALWPFRRALRSMGWAVECPKGQEKDPVDPFIISRIEGLVAEVHRGREGRVVLFAHDRHYAPMLFRLLEGGGDAIVVGFTEEMSPWLLNLQESGATVLDLEYDIEAFDVALSRPYGRREWRTLSVAS